MSSNLFFNLLNPPYFFHLCLWTSRVSVIPSFIFFILVSSVSLKLSPIPFRGLHISLPRCSTVCSVFRLSRVFLSWKCYHPISLESFPLSALYLRTLVVTFCVCVCARICSDSLKSICLLKCDSLPRLSSIFLSLQHHASCIKYSVNSYGRIWLNTSSECFVSLLFSKVHSSLI